MWQNVDNQLYKNFAFKDYGEAVAFMNQVAGLAQAANHHPKLLNSYNQVEIWLTTHTAGDKVTDKDLDLADKIDQLVTAPPPETAFTDDKHVKLYGDGGSRGNPGPSASGFVILDMDDNIIFKAGVYLGHTTNNQAEYQSLVFGLQKALAMGVEEVDVYMDSQLVINQMMGTYKIRNQELKPHHTAINELVTKFRKVTFTHVPRELNKLADAEVNTTLDLEAGI